MHGVPLNTTQAECMHIGAVADRQAGSLAAFGWLSVASRCTTSWPARFTPRTPSVSSGQELCAVYGIASLTSHDMLCCMLCEPCAVFLLMFADVMPLTTHCMHTYVACTSTTQQRASTTLCFSGQVSASQHRAQRQQASRHICDCKCSEFVTSSPLLVLFRWLSAAKQAGRHLFSLRAHRR